MKKGRRPQALARQSNGSEHLLSVVGTYELDNTAALVALTTRLIAIASGHRAAGNATTFKVYIRRVGK